MKIHNISKNIYGYYSKQVDREKRVETRMEDWKSSLDIYVL